MPDSAPSFPVRIPVRVVGTELPGLRFGQYEPVHIALKRGTVAEAVSPADVPEVVFDLYVDVKPDREGRLDYRGPYIAGLGKDDRALGLLWGMLTPDDRFVLFRGAKLRLPPIDDKLLRAAAAGRTLQASVLLTDECGGPRCARLPETVLQWSFVAAPGAPSGDARPDYPVSRHM